MEIRIIKAVYDDSGDIRPVGKALENEYGEFIACPKYKQGISYLEFDTWKTKCTKCDYEELLF